MRKIRLYGHLSTFADVVEYEVSTAGEAIRALCINFPGFKQALEQGYYHVVIGKKQSGHALDTDDVNDFHLGRGDLHIIPCAKGAKRGGVLKAILGVALVGAALFFSGGMLGAAIPGLAGGVTWGNVAMIGLGLAIAGASQMLTPSQKKSDEESDSSYTLAGPTNSYEQGNPVPLVYGEVIVGAQLISGGVSIEQLKKAV